MKQQNPYALSVFSIRLIRLVTLLLLWYALVQRSLPLAAASGGVLLITYGTLLWSKFALRHLEAQLIPGRVRMFPGDACPVTLTLKNWKLLPVWVEVTMICDAQVDMKESGQFKTFLLSWDERRITRQLVPKKRGVFTLGTAGLKAGDMLGLHAQTKDISFPRELIVYPEKRTAFYPALQFQEFFGLTVSKDVVEDPCWYAGTRDYTGTRPAKTIHWKASARLGSLQEKIFDATSHRKVLLLLDARGFAESFEPSHGTADDFEKLIEAAAALAGDLMENGSSFSLAVNAELTGASAHVLPAGRGPEHLGSVLELLARTLPHAVRDILPMTSRPEYRGAGIVYFGFSPPHVNEITASQKAPLLFICTDRPRQEHPYYLCSEVIG